MYHASLPMLIHGLGNLSHILAKAEAHAQQKNIAPEVFLNARLAPDMFPLVKQVQIVSDISKFGASRLSGIDAPAFPDTETTFDALQQRIANTIAYLKTIDAAHINGTEDKPIHLNIGGTEYNFTGQNYLLTFVLPNIYFHITTAYGILRHHGVALGKADFLGNV
jgi:hypothetical protein